MMIKYIFPFCAMAIISVNSGPIEFLTDVFTKSPKGRPFNPIPGPAGKQSRIGVVGAGIGGIYSAYQLKKKGFANITVLESTGRIGGKIKTDVINGQNHIMGAMLVNVGQVVYNTLQELELLEYQDLNPSIWSDHTSHSVLSKSLEYQISEMDVPNRVIAAVNLLKASRKFQHIFDDLFGTEQAGLFLEPEDPRYLKLFEKSIYQFLMDEGLQELIPMVTIFFSAFGYGSIFEMSCYYFFTCWLKRSVPIWMSAAGVNTDLEKMVHTLIEKEDIEVILNKNVEFVTSQDGRLVLKINGDETEEFDFLVWAAPLSAFSQRSDIYSAEEEKLFGSISSLFMGCNLMDVENYESESSSNFFYDEIVNFDSEVCANVDTPAIHEGIVSPETYKKYLRSMQTPNGRRTISTFHYGNEAHFLTEEQLQQKSVEFYKNVFNATVTKFHDSVILKYAAHWSPENVAKGYPWRMHDLQGKHNILFVGGSLVFESVQHVMEHVNFILDLVDMDS